MGTKIEKPIKNYLLDFGLTDKEVTCYLTLLKTGPNTIMNLSRETGIKRSTTHNTVEELIKKGLISQTNYGERRMIVAEDPEKLKFLMEQKKWDIKKLEENMSDIVKTIYDLVPKVKENTQVDVRYYEGEKVVFGVYQNSWKYDEVYSFVNLEKYFEIYPDTGELWNQVLKKNPKRKLYALTTNSVVARETQKTSPKGYISKTIGGTLPFGNLDIHIYDNEVSLINLEPNKTSAIVIKSETISSTMRALHKLIWELA